MKQPLRVAVTPELADESMFELPDFDAPADAPARTKNGEPWTRWGHYGTYEGWYAIGSRRVEKIEARPKFWDATFYVACQATGGNLDQAHCCGPGILSLGGLGVTLRSGFAQILLHECLLTDPERFMQIMAPVIHETGVYTKQTEKAETGIALADSKGNPVVAEKAMREIVMLGSDGIQWTQRQKKRARLWVTACSKLLRDARMDEAQAAFAEHVMPALLTERTKEIVRWPRNGMRDSWQYTHEQQALWALVMVMGLEDAEETERLVAASVAGEGRYPDASTSLANLCAYATAGVGDAYGERLRRALPLLLELFRITELPSPSPWEEP
jgi:hypothetical protein